LNELQRLRQRVAALEETERQYFALKKRLEQIQTFFDPLLANSLDPSTLKDLDGNHLLVNEAYCRLLGKSAQEIIGRSNLDLFPTEQAARFQENDQQVINSAQSQMVVELIDVSEGARWLQIAKNPVFGEEQQCLGVLHSIRDVTEHKETLKALQSSQQRLTRITDAVPALIGYIDTEQHYRFNNKAYERWFGRQATGQPIKEILGPETYATMLPNIQAALSGKEVKYEAWAPYSYGGKRYVQAHYTPDTNAAGETTGFYVLVNDLTEHKLSEDTLAKKDLLLRQLFDSSPIGLALVPLTGKTSASSDARTLVNSAMLEFFGYTAEEIPPMVELSPPDEHVQEQLRIRELLIRELLAGKRDSYKLEKRYIRKDGSTTWGNVTISLLEGHPMKLLMMLEDINGRKNIELQLRRAHDSLESKVQERTIDLEARRDELQEVNTALRVVLRQREEDKKTIESQVMLNLEKLVMPSIDRLRKTHLQDSQIDSLQILQTNLEQIVSPYVRKVNSIHLQLTPTELQVADMVKQGLSSKKIATLIHLSPETVGVHRKNIRKKLGLRDQKVNLQTFLTSLDC